MKIAITGALGHIGSYLIKSFPDDFSNYKFYLIDNFKTQRYTSLFNLPSNFEYKFYEYDVRDEQISQIVQEVDIVIHLAAITDATLSFKNAKEVEENNFLTTKKLTNLCVKYNSKLIMISSTSVYGKQTQ